jgi:hypothetical protein
LELESELELVTNPKIAEKIENRQFHPSPKNKGRPVSRAAL